MSGVIRKSFTRDELHDRRPKLEAVSYAVLHMVNFYWDIKFSDVICAAVESDGKSYGTQRQIVPRGWNVEKAWDGGIQFSSDEPIKPEDCIRMEKWLQQMQDACETMAPEED